MALSHPSFLSFCLVLTIPFTTSFSAYKLQQVFSKLKKQIQKPDPIWVSPSRQSQAILCLLSSFLLNPWMSNYPWLCWWNHFFIPASDSPVSKPSRPSSILPGWGPFLLGAHPTVLLALPGLVLFLFGMFTMFSPLSPPMAKNPILNRECYLIEWLWGSDRPEFKPCGSRITNCGNLSVLFSCSVHILQRLLRTKGASPCRVLSSTPG